MSFRIDKLYLVLKVSHLARASISADGISLGKLWMILAALQCNLSGASKSSLRLTPPQTAMPYVTDGIMTLKYSFKTCFGKNLHFLMRLNLFAKFLQLVVRVRLVVWLVCTACVQLVCTACGTACVYRLWYGYSRTVLFYIRRMRILVC